MARAQPAVPAPFVKEAVFPPAKGFGRFVRGEAAESAAVVFACSVCSVDPQVWFLRITSSSYHCIFQGDLKFGIVVPSAFPFLPTMPLPDLSLL